MVVAVKLQFANESVPHSQGKSPSPPPPRLLSNAAKRQRSPERRLRLSLFFGLKKKIYIYIYNKKIKLSLARFADKVYLCRALAAKGLLCIFWFFWWLLGVLVFFCLSLGGTAQVKPRSRAVFPRLRSRAGGGGARSGAGRCAPFPELNKVLLNPPPPIPQKRS